MENHVPVAVLVCCTLKAIRRMFHPSLTVHVPKLSRNTIRAGRLCAVLTTTSDCSGRSSFLGQVDFRMQPQANSSKIDLLNCFIHKLPVRPSTNRHLSPSSINFCHFFALAFEHAPSSAVAWRCAVPCVKCKIGVLLVCAGEGVPGRLCRVPKEIASVLVWRQCAQHVVTSWVVALQQYPPTGLHPRVCALRSELESRLNEQLDRLRGGDIITSDTTPWTRRPPRWSTQQTCSEKP